jgi:integrase
VGATTFATYVEETWFPSKHLELSTRQGYRSNLDRHFLPYFGHWPMAKILPSVVQGWVTKAVSDGLSATSVRKDHTMLHSIFERAVRGHLILTNPCAHTELPKIIKQRTRTLTPDEFGRLLAVVPQRHVLLVLTAIETGARWGKLIALRPRRIDFLRRTVTIEETIVEVSKRSSPSGERMVVKPYPKDNEPRTFGVRPHWLDEVAAHIRVHGIGRDELLLSTEAGTPISRNTFRTRVWLPAVQASGVDFGVRVRPPTRPLLLAAGRRRRPEGRDGADGARSDPDHAEVPAHASRDRPEEPRRAVAHRRTRPYTRRPRGEALPSLRRVRAGVAAHPTAPRRRSR